MKSFTLILLFLPLFSLNLPAQELEKAEIDPSYKQEIDQLLQHPKVKNAMGFIKANDNITIQDNITLNEIPAPPFGEDDRSLAFAQMMKKLGVDSIWIDEEGNALALRKGTKGDRTVVLDAHLDTVFPEGTDVTVHVSGDTLFAPGIGDDTRGLAMVLAVLRTMNAYDIQTEADVLFVGTVGEEGLGDLRGVKYLFREGGPKIDSWISIDGGELGRVNNKGLGSLRYRVIFRGPGGHSWGAFGLANPHHAAAAGIRHFVEAADKFTSYGARTSYNVGRMGGGTSVNSIPFSSWMEIDMRSHSPARLDSIANIMKEAMQKGLEEQNAIRRRGRPLQLEMEVIGDRPSGELSADLPLIQRAMAVSEYFGVEPRLTRGSTNANTPISLGIPAVTIGRGGTGGWGHSLLEYWVNEEGYKGVQNALLILLAESGLSK
jgi:acetylornithine deacetylase/succinyl-diaminopimelate desuccinylase-like protein